MPKGIVRAAERVAVWHQAAPEPLENQAPTSPPPMGVEQKAAPKSNKFTIPANGLKKTLDVAAHPSEGFHAVSTEGIQNWAGTNQGQSFVNTYFKPHYQD